MTRNANKPPAVNEPEFSSGAEEIRGTLRRIVWVER
jgi:hypothetical protein